MLFGVIKYKSYVFLRPYCCWGSCGLFIEQVKNSQATVANKVTIIKVRKCKDFLFYFISS